MVVLTEEDGTELVMNESMCIIEYFEERFPSLPKLMPDNLAHKYQVRRLCEHCNCLVQPLANLSVLQEVEARFGKEARQPWGVHWDSKGMTAFEEHIKATSGKYCFGDSITLADLFMIPMVYRATRFDLDPKQWPLIWAIHERLQEE